MFNIGTQEFLIILLVVLILFGAKRIPEISRSLGKGLADFRDAMAGVERELKGEPNPRRGAPPALPAAEGPAPQVVPGEMERLPDPSGAGGRESPFQEEPPPPGTKQEKSGGEDSKGWSGSGGGLAG